MSLEIAFRPFDNPEEALKADERVIELAAEYSKDPNKFNKVLAILEESHYIRGMYERERENNALKFDNKVMGAYSKIYRAVTDLITVIESEEFRGKSIDRETAYNVVREVRNFDPKTRLMTGMNQFIRLYKTARGVKRLVYIYRAARASFRLGRVDFAIDMLDKVVFNINHPAAYVLGELLAFFYRYKGDKESELKVLERTLEILPLRTRIRHRLAFLYGLKNMEAHVKRARVLYKAGYGVPLAAYSAIEAIYVSKTRKFFPNTDRAKYYLALTALISHPEEL